MGEYPYTLIWPIRLLALDRCAVEMEQRIPAVAFLGRVFVVSVEGLETLSAGVTLGDVL